MNSGFEPAKPPANVICFLDSIGSKCAAAFTLSAGVGEEHCVAVRREKFSIGTHALPVITNAMEEDDRIAIVRCWPHEPSSQLGAISSFYPDILKRSSEPTGGSLDLLAPFDGYP